VISSPVIKLHDEYDPQERKRLRRKARREVEGVALKGPTRDSGKPFFVEVPAEIAHDTHRPQVVAASEMIRRCTAALEIEVPTVRWTIEVSPAQAGDLVEKGLKDALGLRRLERPAGGHARPQRITLRLGQSPRHLARLAAHECRHLFHPPDMAHDQAEEDAESFAEGCMRLWWGEIEKRVSQISS
jgi:hypothetical protein